MLMKFMKIMKLTRSRYKTLRRSLFPYSQNHFLFSSQNSCFYASRETLNHLGSKTQVKTVKINAFFDGLRSLLLDRPPFL